MTADLEHPVKVFVAGELWEYALVSRSRHSLSEQAIPSYADVSAFGKDNRPMSYASIVSRQLERQATRPLCILPAGMIARPGFSTALRTLAESPASLTGSLFDKADITRMLGIRQPLLVTTSGVLPILGMLAPAASSAHLGHACLAEIMVDRPAPTQRLPKTYHRGRPLQRREGEDVYQAIETGFADPEQLEPPLSLPDRATLDQEVSGWVYRCNNEPLAVELAAARACDAVVAVGAGIKPWHIANELRNHIRRLVIVDSEPAQLGFARRVERKFSSSASWAAICELPTYRSDNDRRLMSSHERLFTRIKQGQPHWRFQVTYVEADILSQTFRLIRALKSLQVEKPLFWYSNIFQPYLGPALSEQHTGMEYSFATLFRKAFPKAVLFNAGVSPVLDPRLQMSESSLLRRAYRVLKQGRS